MRRFLGKAAWAFPWLGVWAVRDGKGLPTGPDRNCAPRAPGLRWPWALGWGPVLASAGSVQ